MTTPVAVAAEPIDQSLPDAESLARIAQQLIELCRQQGADAVQVSLDATVGLTLSVRQDELESIEFQRDQEISVTAYRGQRRAHGTSTDLTESALSALAERISAMASHAGEDQWAGLPDRDQLATTFPDLDLDHPWDTDIAELTEAARSAEQAARDADARITNSEGASIDTRRTLSLVANSQGFCGHQFATDHSISCSVIAGEADGMQRDYWYDVNRAPGRLASPDTVGRTAAERAVSRLDARPIETGRFSVLFAAEAARSLFGALISAIRGRPLYQRSSFLLDAVGERLFPESVNVQQRPFLPAAIGSAAFDQEGVRTRDRDIIDAGVLTGYVLNSYAGRRLGLETTGNAGGVFNLLVSGGGGDRAAMLRQLGTGFFVTEMMGQGANLATGDYSRGAAGFWVENGVITSAVQEVTIAGNLRDMFRAIVAIGDDVDARGNTRCGSVLIESMTVAGESS